MIANHRSTAVLFCVGVLWGTSTGCSDEACEGPACVDTVATPGTALDAGDNDTPDDEEPRPDASPTLPRDGSVMTPSPDAGLDASVGGELEDAGFDAGGGFVEVDAGTFPPLTVEEFCAASLAPGQAWADKLEECCSSDALASWEREQLLTAFGYPAFRFGGGGQAACVEGINNMLASGIEFHPEHAGACAHFMAANYKLEPPAACPGGDGFFVPEILSKVGKAAQLREQIPACRRAFVGSAKAGEPCDTDLHCAEGRVCEFDIGSSECVDAAKEGDKCQGSQTCAPGLYCKGLVGGYRICTRQSELGKIGAACHAHSECADGLWCNRDIHKCDPVPKRDTLAPDGESCATMIFVPYFQCQGYCTSEQECAPFCAQ